MASYERVLPYAAAALIFVGGLVVLFNAIWLVRQRITGRHHSSIPLIGAVFLGTGLALLPQTRSWWWIAILVDYGTLSLLAILPRIWGEFLATSRSQLLETWHSEDATRRVELRLYKKDVFVLQQVFHRKPGELGLVQLSTSGSWSREDERLLLEAANEGGQAEFLAQAGGLVQTTGFAPFEQQEETSLAGLSLQRVPS